MFNGNARSTSVFPKTADHIIEFFAALSCSFKGTGSNFTVSGFLILVSIGIMIQIFLGNLGQPEGTEFGDTIDKTDFKTLLLVAASMATYPLLIERAGFIVASSVAFFGVSFAFGARNVLKNLAISIVFSAIVYFSFTRGLNVNLPSGILGGI
jgi:putative tricarboxylic transport membrane protein